MPKLSLLWLFVLLNLVTLPALCQIAWDTSNTILSIKNQKSEFPAIEFNYQSDFITAGTNEVSVKSNYGSYHFKEKMTAKSSVTLIQSIYTAEETVIVKGVLKDSDFEIPFSLFLEESTDDKIHFQLIIESAAINKLTLRFRTSPEEHYFGFGEQASFLDMKGKNPFIWTEEQGIGRGDAPVTFFMKLAGAAGNHFTSYAPIPFFISSRHRAVFIENTAYVSFDFSAHDYASVTTWSNELEGYIFPGSAPRELIEAYTAHTGRLPALPDWAYGTCLGLQGGTDKVRKVVNEAKRAGNPVTSVWLQDWVGRRETRYGSQLWWRWIPDESAYPEFKKFCAEMNQQGVKVLGYINSFLADEGMMYEFARDHNFLVKDPFGNDYPIKTPGFPAYLIDLTNPDAFNWMKEIIKTNLIGNSLSGWMADYGEWLPLDAKLHSGISAWDYHNQYAVDWARLNREAIQEAGKEGEILFFVRSGHSYSNKYATLFWTGDQMVNWKKYDGFRSSIVSVLSGGMSGISLNHSDIGGYTTVKKFIRIRRSKELLFRWAECNAFMPFFRTHEGLLPDFNAQVYSDVESIDFFSGMGQLHHSLKDYFKFYVHESVEKGYPVVRPLYFQYPGDVNTFDLQYQFLVGEDLLVIPVIKKGGKSVKGYFPVGSWENVWTREIIRSPGFHKIEAPVGQPAAFIKVGGKTEPLLRKSLSKFLQQRDAIYNNSSPKSHYE